MKTLVDDLKKEVDQIALGWLTYNSLIQVLKADDVKHCFF